MWRTHLVTKRFLEKLEEKVVGTCWKILPQGVTLDRICFEMAVKGENGCALVKNEELKQQLRDQWATLLRESGCKDVDLDKVADGQPFYLRLMRELLVQCDDPDRDFLLQGEIGYPVGI